MPVSGAPFSLQVPAAGETRHLAGLPGAAEALALARLAQRRRVVVLAHDAGAAVRLVDQLRSVMETGQVHHLVGWEVLPYDATSPPRATVSARIAALSSLVHGMAGVYVTAAADAMLPCPPPDKLAVRALRLKVGDKVNVKRLVRDLAAAGCASVDRVRAAGEYSLYGGQLDLYPGAVRQPYRLVLDDETIAQIRAFDPATQLSTGRCEKLEMMPAREYPLDEETVLAFRQRWRERFAPDVSKDVYDNVSEGEEAEGAEFFLPLFYDRGCAWLFDYLNRRDVVWLQDGWGKATEAFAALAHERRAQANLVGQAALPPDELFLPPAALRERCAAQPAFDMEPAGEGAKCVDLGARELPPLAAQHGAAKPYGRFAAWLSRQRGRIVFSWADQSRLERVKAALGAAGKRADETESIAGAKHGCFLHGGTLTGGFVHEDAKLALVTEAELHGYVPAPHSHGRAMGSRYELFEEISPGNLVTHRDHGVARYLGLETIVDDGIEDEFIALEFANDVKLYVAVSHCHLISLHCQPVPGEQVKLHSMGGSRWQRQRAKAAQVARDTAAHLLSIYAERASSGRPPMLADPEKYARFCAAFAHAETVDQSRVSDEVLADMAKPEPMDRLLCGDVGFGKTEVAMRAAWVAWQAGYQVAIVAPTTLLADQLLNAFIDRFAGNEAMIVGLSSLQAEADNDQARAALAAGIADIVIGTHALLGKKVRFPNLGLVIIDEEHRFGVRQKERLRELRAEVDVLALSATPIPRTLSMALEGMRDISLLATPPANRLEVRTFVTRDGDAVMREALAREFARGGQAFVVHHRVQTIGAMADRVADLLPDGVVEVAHGQMPHARLEEVMRRFYRGAIDVLVCTTIIESGIDVPNANTMVVPRADMFGLAQLHQLRGRVGRSDRQAYAYLLTPGETSEHRAAASRLGILEEASGLGSGYRIAVRDMEIRGAGEILGDAQSGIVTNIGIETFQRMLANALRAERGDPAVDDCQVDFGAHARLPDSYCANPVERMRMYRQLAAAADDARVLELRDEMADRFGPVPLQARLLVDSHRLRLQAARLGAVRVEATVNYLRFFFSEDPACADCLLDFARERTDCRLGADHSLHIAHAAPLHDQMALAFSVCSRLAGDVAFTS